MFEITRILYFIILISLSIYSVITFRQGHKIIKSYAIITLIVECIGISFLIGIKISSGYLYNIHALIEIVLWLLLFKSIIEIKVKNLVLIFSLYFIVFLKLGNFNFYKLNNNGFLLNNALITVLIGYYFFKIIQNKHNLNGYFWIAIGALFYNLGGFLLTGMIQFLARKNLKFGSELFKINILLNVAFYSFILYGVFLLNKKEPEGS